MVKQAIRPAIFTWRHTEPELILCAVRWSLRDSLSFRDGEERLRARGLEADPTTIWRWVQHDGPELEERLRRHLKPTKKSWRVDETDVCVRANDPRHGRARHPFSRSTTCNPIPSTPTAGRIEAARPCGAVYTRTARAAPS